MKFTGTKSFKPKPTISDDEQQLDSSVLSFISGSEHKNTCIPYLIGATIYETTDYVSIQHEHLNEAEEAKKNISYILDSIAGPRTIRFQPRYWFNRPSCKHEQAWAQYRLDPLYVNRSINCECYTCERDLLSPFQKFDPTKKSSSAKVSPYIQSKTMNQINSIKQVDNDTGVNYNEPTLKDEPAIDRNLNF